MAPGAVWRYKKPALFCLHVSLLKKGSYVGRTKRKVKEMPIKHTKKGEKPFFAHKKSPPAAAGGEYE